MRIWRWLCLPVGGFLWALAAAISATAEPVRVVATIKPVHALVAQLLEGIATPELLVKGSASPHSFSLKPSDMRALSGATVVVRVGNSVEPFMAKVIEALPKTVTLVTLIEAPGMELLPRRAGSSFAEHDHDHHDGEHGHAHGNEDIDAHIWLDVRNARAIVAAVAAAIAARVPDAAPALERNRAALDVKLAALDAELQRAVERVRSKPIVVFHDSLQYFEHRYGLTVAGSIFTSPDVGPGGKRLTLLRKRLQELNAACAFGEPFGDQRLLKALVEGTTVRVGVLDTEGQALEPGPDLYFTLMRDLAKNVRTCLEAAS